MREEEARKAEGLRGCGCPSRPNQLNAAKRSALCGKIVGDRIGIIGTFAKFGADIYNEEVTTPTEAYLARGIRWRRAKRALGRLGAVLEANPAGKQFARLGDYQIELPAADRDRVELSEDELRSLLSDAERMGIAPRDLLNALSETERKGRRRGAPVDSVSELNAAAREAERVGLGALLDEADLEPSERDSLEKQVLAELSHARSSLSQEITEVKGMAWPPGHAPSFTERGANAVKRYLEGVLGRPIVVQGDLPEPGPEDTPLYDVIMNADGDRDDLESFYRSSQRSFRKGKGRLYKELAAAGNLFESAKGKGRGRFYVNTPGARQALDYLSEYRSDQRRGVAPLQDVSVREGPPREPSAGNASEVTSHASGELTSGEAFALICQHFGVFPRIGEALSLDVGGTMIDIARKIIETRDEQKRA